MKAKPPLRIGLLVDSTVVSQYDFELMNWACTQADLHVSHLIVHGVEHRSGFEQDGPATPSLLSRVRRVVARQGFSEAVRNLLWRHTVASERRLLKGADDHGEAHFASHDISGMGAQELRITPIVSPSGFVYRFSDADVARVRDAHLDLLIRCGSGILRGEILTCTRLGVLSFHHADNRVNRGGPPGFWEVFLRQATTGFTIQRLTDVLDGGQVLMRGHFPTKPFYLKNQIQLFRKANVHMQHLIHRIVCDTSLPPTLEPTPYPGRLLRTPSTWQSISYLYRRLSYRVRKSVRHRLGYRNRWHVGYCQGDWSNAEMFRGAQIENPPGCFLADPFVISREGMQYCFVEEMVVSSQRGCISVYELGSDPNVTRGVDDARRLGVALAEPFHLSFPFLFEFDDQLYMCPETCEKREIRVYKCDEFPLRWSLASIVMKNIASADTMLFEHDGRWWMFTNPDLSNSDEYCSELNIYWADSPLSKQWCAHPGNPIIVDARNARNGGLLRKDGQLYRVGQEQGFDVYGLASRVFQIEKLSRTEYREREVIRLEPQFAAGVTGGHHLHSNGMMTVFDFRRWVRD